MDLFDVLKLIGGLCLFLFGMNVMGKALEQRAGDSLRSLLGKMTTGKLSGFLTGCGITAIIQSSSATTVMVVGFVNSGLMDLRQAINVIMGSNVGTTVTAWILSLSGISSDNIWVQLLKPSSFVPVIALVGIILFMMGKTSQKKDTGTILLGFAVLMFGMESMSDAASGLADIPAFQQLFILFENPLLGVLAGAVLTAVIQSSSASVGILQVLAATGQVSFGAAIPIIMGTCIGTCITAMLSSIGANREARRAAMAHLSFNVLGAALWTLVFMIARAIWEPAILAMPASLLGIAVINTLFNLLTAALFLPFGWVLEAIVIRAIPEKPQTDTKTGLLETYQLDERLLVTPSLAMERCEAAVARMAEVSIRTLEGSIRCIETYDSQLAETIRKDEKSTDEMEDALGTFLIRLSSQSLRQEESERVTVLLKIIGDYERIADHSVNILESAEEMEDRNIRYTRQAGEELKVLTDAVRRVADMTTRAFLDNDLQLARQVEPLEEVIDNLKEQMRTSHILRMKRGACSIEAGFVWSDLLTNLERISDHCSNIAGCVWDLSRHNLNLHETLRMQKENRPTFEALYHQYADQYSIS